MKGKGTNGLTMADVQALRQGIAQAAANGAEALAACDEMDAERRSRYAELIAQLRDVTAQLEEAARTMGALRGPLNRGPALAAYNKAATAYSKALEMIPDMLRKLQAALNARQ